ncbi:11695_t:CDS:2, partial [Gigaspora rosea]
MTSTNILFDDIFDNTHSELSLQQQIEEFQITYQSNVEITSINNQIEQDSYNQEEFNEFDISKESTLNESVLTNEQIDKFKKIYSKDKIENIEDNNNSIQNIKKKLDKKDEEAQYKKLQTIICCNEKCLNLISHEHAIANYQKFQNL